MKSERETPLRHSETLTFLFNKNGVNTLPTTLYVTIFTAKPSVRKLRKLRA